jgi:NAD(P)-dependent dehydrogenase (short-subunit alcohol dehydrogenase family)
MATILITGANRGIGFALARTYLERRDAVIGACRKPREASELAALAGPSGNRVEIAWIDVTNPLSIARTRDSLRGRPIDVLINNAGIMGPERQSAADMDFDGFLHTLDANTIGPLRVTQAFLPNLEKVSPGKAFGKIANISSGMGSFSGGAEGDLAYRASKAALNKLTQGMAAELKRRGIAVIAVNPGWVKTDMGGKSAPLPVSESALGIVKVIDALTLAGTGAFTSHDGSNMAW